MVRKWRNPAGVGTPDALKGACPVWEGLGRNRHPKGARRSHSTSEVITIYGILCLSSEEAPRMAHVQFTDVQDRPTEFLDLTSLTRDEFPQLVPPFEACLLYTSPSPRDS